MYKCKKCEKEFKSKYGLNSHIGWHNNPNRESNFITYNKSVINGDRKSSNQFIKAKEKGETYIVSDVTRKKISDKRRGSVTSQETKDKISESMKLVVLNNPEKYTNKSHRGVVKSIEYNGMTLLGEWELLVSKWLDLNSIKWTNKLKGIPYEWNNKTHLYFPDFYLIDFDIYLEVKGLQRNRDVNKWNSINNLIVFKKHEINLIKNNKLDISILSNFKSILYEYSDEKMKLYNKLDDKIKEENFCLNCGKEIHNKKTKYCSILCVSKYKSKIPPIEELIYRFKELKTFVKVGIYYNVSNNTIKKWCIKYEILEEIKNKSR